MIRGSLDKKLKSHNSTRPSSEQQKKDVELLGILRGKGGGGMHNVHVVLHSTVNCVKSEPIYNMLACLCISRVGK